MNPVQTFAECARRFIAWAERSDPPAEREDAREVLGILIRLYGAALELPDGKPAKDEVEHTSQEEWSAVYRRCANLPFDSYWEIFNPLETPVEEPVAATLGDDLADIHRDLKQGMIHFETGNSPAAAWDWQLAFRSHWGHHASAAINALHAWYADEFFA
jgi:hypothetical protein